MIDSLVELLVTLTSGVMSICIVILHMAFWCVVAGILLELLL